MTVLTEDGCVDDGADRRRVCAGDVFRAPVMPRVLAVYVGTGLQLSVRPYLTRVYQVVLQKSNPSTYPLLLLL